MEKTKTKTFLISKRTKLSCFKQLVYDQAEDTIFKLFLK